MVVVVDYLVTLCCAMFQKLITAHSPIVDFQFCSTTFCIYVLSGMCTATKYAPDVNSRSEILTDSSPLGITASATSCPTASCRVTRIDASATLSRLIVTLLLVGLGRSENSPTNSSS